MLRAGEYPFNNPRFAERDDVDDTPGDDETVDDDDFEDEDDLDELDDDEEDLEADL